MEKKIQIGEYEVIAIHSLLIPKDAIASIPVRISQVSLTLEIKFDDETETDKSISFSVDKTNRIVTMVFHKWNSSLGTTFKEIEKLLTLTAGQPLFFMASNYRIGDANNFTLQILQRKGGIHAGE